MTGPQTLARPLSQRALTLAQPPQEPMLEADIPEAAIAAGVAALERGETHYTDRPGIGALRSLIADDLNRRFSLGLKAGDVTITCGATEARFAVIRLLNTLTPNPFAATGSGQPKHAGPLSPSGRGEKEMSVVCPGNSTLIAGAIHLTGAKLEKDTTGGASLIYLTPSDDPAVITSLLDYAKENSVWVVWDESLVKSADFHPATDLELTPRVVTVGGLDEQMPGWRVGWMAGSQAAEKLRAFKQSMTICATSVSQWAAVEMMKL